MGTREANAGGDVATGDTFDPAAALDAPELAEAIALLDSLRELWWEPVGPGAGPGFYRCRVCRATGPWPSEIRHGAMPATDAPSRPCRIARFPLIYLRLSDRHAALAGHPADSPIVTGP